MDINRLTLGEKIAAAAGVALLLIMFIFSWFGIDEAGANAWESFSFIDLILFVTALAAIALAVLSARPDTVSLPVALSAIVTGLGVLSVLLILFRIISPPDFGVGDVAVPGFEIDLDIGPKIGAFLGLIAAAAIAYGGWRSMQEEGTTFSGEADRLGDRGDSTPGAGPGATTPGAGPTTGAGTTGTTGTTTTPGSQPPPPPPPPPPGGPAV